MKKLLTFFLTALLAFSVGWAETTIVTASKVTASSVNWTGSSNETWSVNVSGGATNQNLTNSYAQIGTKNSPSTSVTFSTSGITGTITSIVVDCASYNGLGTISATVGGNAFGTQDQSIPSWSSNTGGNVTFSGSASGAIVITMTNGSGGRAMYIKSITVTYEAGGSTPVTVDAPVFSINGTTVTDNQTVEAGTVVTITAASGNYISYTTDGSDPSGSAATLSDANTATITVNATTRIRAIAIDDDLNSSDEVDYTFTVNSGGSEPSSSTVYRKVTSTDDLEAGKQYIIVYENGSSSAAMSAFNGTVDSSTGKLFSAVTGLSLNNNRIDIANNSNVLVLTLGGSTDAWTLHTGSGYIRGTDGVNFTVQSSLTAGDKVSRWKISADGVVNNSYLTDRYIRYYSNNPSFRHYTTSYGDNAYLYVQESSDPTLSVSANELSIEVPYNESSANATFTVTGSNLTENSVSVSVSGADFSVLPTSIAVANGSVNQEITVTYNGTSTTPVTGTVTVTCGDLTETVTVTAQKQTPPPPTMTVSTNSLTVGANGGSFNVTAANLTQALTVTPSTGFSVNPTSLATDATYPAAVNVTYTGQALSATGDVTVSNTADNLTETVNVTYVYDGNMYIVGDVNNTSWDFVNGVLMTRNQDGTYSAHVTAQANGWYNGVQYAWLYFTKAVGSEAIVAANAFGPLGGDQWGMTPNLYGQWCDLDQNGDVNTIYMNSGSYEIVVDPVNNKFKITPDVASPVITPATGTYHEAQTVEITCSTPGATIYYTTDGTTPTTSSTQYTGSFTVDATTTVTAIAVSNGLTSTPATSTITIKLHGQGDFYLVTDAADLNAGDEIIFVNKNAVNASALAMSTTQNSNNRGTTQVAVVSTPDMSVADEYEDMQIVFLEGDATNGWYFNVGDETDQYLYAASSSSNHLKTQSTKDDNAKATISISSDVATITFQGTNTHNVMQFNNDIVSCYGSASQQDVYIYKRGTAQPRITVDPSTMELVIPAGGTSQSATATVTEHNTTGTTTVAITGEGASHFNATLENGTLTVTYNGTATAATPDVATVTLTNGTATAEVTVSGYRLPLTVTITPADGHNFQGSTVNGLIESNVDNATIEYSFDGTTWQTYDAEQGFTATVATVGGTVTVYARVTASNGQTATAQATYTRVPKASTCTADIAFAPTSNNGEMSQWSTFVTHIGEGNDYISSTGSSVSKLWTSQSYNAMRFGSGNYTGKLVLALDLSKFETGACKLAKVTINAARYGSDGDNCALKVSSSANSTGVTQNITASQDQFGDYVFNFDGSEVTSITIENTSTTNGRVYVHSISIEYNCGASVESPAITPATGTYYEDQTVEITSAVPGATIYYTTDGTTPTPSSQQYNDPFVVEHQSGSTTTINAIAVINEDEEQSVSEPATVVYTWGTPSVVISPDSRNVTVESVTVTMTGTPANATIYYTTDGSTPTTASEQYNGAFSVSLPNVGDVANVKAIAVYNGLTSEVATATYTRVDKVIDVKAPFFSPLAGTNGGYNGIYYGEQTLQIGCTTPNADIYYKIEEVTGETAPATVADPTKQSSYYDATQTITMEVGKSYRVKAIAYVGGFASTITEGYYIIKTADPDYIDIDWPSASESEYYVTSCKEFNELSSSYEGKKFIFVNPVQVVYHSTYVNNGTSAEFCYVRDNTDYACVYFGKADTHNYHIFKMGDWIAGNAIEGPMDVYEHNYHNQLGTSNHTINATLWPTEAIGWTEIVPETTTCTDIASGTPAAGKNKWGHYVHVRYSTMSDVHDEKGYQSSGDYDMKHTGSIQDLTDVALNYYDKFYLWSAGNCRYGSNTYTINCKGDYTQEFFDTKKNAGATFDVFGVVDWYGTVSSGNYNGNFQVCPIDFLWAYKPVITVTPGETVTGQVDTYAVPQTVTISATQPEWAAESVVIYYKTDDMDDWAEYTGPFVVSSNTSVQTYAEVYAKKNDAAETDYNDYVRSVTVSQDFKFQGIEDPEIAPGSQVIEIVNGNETVEVVIAANNDNNSNVITVYTTDGTMPSATNGTEIAAGERVELDPITETTTVTAISYLPDANGNPVLWSNVVTETYTFVKKNGVIYDLLTTTPKLGNVYVIVNKDAYMGLSTKQNENNRGSVGVMFTDDTKTKVYGNDELALFVLEKADGNRYYFKNINGNGYLTVAGNTGLQTGDADYYASASVEIGDQSAGYPATITFRGDNLRTMRYFDNGRTFSTYTDASLNKDVFLYGVNATPLAYIESTPSLEGKQVTVSDQLIGAWAVDYVNADNEHINLLWAKDQGYSIDKTEINTEIGQKDYVKSILKYENKDAWDQSNWVIIDFKNLEESAEDYVGHKLEMASVTGIYSNKDNYTIELNGAAPVKVDNSNEGDAPEFSGYGTDPKADNPQEYTEPGYNTYLPANFLDENLNYPYSEKYEDEGFVAGSDALGTHEGEKLFFMNPKVEEVARIWAVWAGSVDGKDLFTVYVPNLENGINGWAFKGAINVDWCYNRLGSNGGYGRPEYLNDGKKNHAFLFHAAIQLKSQGRSLRATNYTPSDADMNSPLSDRFMVYPLDFPSNADNFTAVVDVKGAKVVESVRYYNIMGMESEQPFEGINIVVTRYSDGSSSTAKVLR